MATRQIYLTTETSQHLDRIMSVTGKSASTIIRELLAKYNAELETMGIVTIETLPGPEDADRPAIVTTSL